MPGDAPPRFRLPPAIRASTFDSYSQISADLAPFFSTEGAIEPGSTLAGKVAEIAAKSNDPLERAALATQFVQDEISYRAQLDYNGDTWGVQLDRLVVGTNFNPEVGFVRREDFRRSFGQFRYSPK